ncbi:MAG: formate dehydrogenase subunit delta [Rhizobiaceae bacterium]
MSHDEQSHSEHHAMNTADKLVYMANQIASFFASQPKEEAAAGVAKHINDYWEPRMRRQFFEIAEAGQLKLSPLVIEALPQIRRPTSSNIK